MDYTRDEFVNDIHGLTHMKEAWLTRRLIAALLFLFFPVLFIGFATWNATVWWPLAVYAGIQVVWKSLYYFRDLSYRGIAECICKGTAVGLMKAGFLSLIGYGVVLAGYGAAQAYAENPQHWIKSKPAPESLLHLKVEFLMWLSGALALIAYGLILFLKEEYEDWQWRKKGRNGHESSPAV